MVIKPVLSWIHGLGRSRQDMVPFASALLPDLECVAPNLLGHARRPLPDRLSVEAFAMDLLATLDRAGIQNPYLVGWSFGGRVALYLARRFPDRFPGVCLLGVNYEEKPAMRIGLRFYDPDREREPPLGPHQRRLYSLIHSWFSDELEKPTYLTDDHLKEIRTPVLIFSGKSDIVVPPHEAEMLHSLLPNARLSMFEGSIHPSKDRPYREVPLDVLRKEVLQFVEDVDSGAFPRNEAELGGQARIPVQPL
jgi:pimeloyl-ACP methyl ester carboxylesterase